jgi:hypothetical protein
VIAEYLKGIPGIEVAGMVGLFVCMAAFAAVVIRTIRARAGDISRYSRIPLDDGTVHEDHTMER